MSNPISFGEAAQLYAENAAIVEVMKKKFYDEVSEFLDQLRQEVENTLSQTVQFKITQGGYRYWWLGDENSDKDGLNHLWVQTSSPEIVHPGLITLTVIAPQAGKDRAYLDRVVTVAKRPEFKSKCTIPPKYGAWNAFMYAVECPSGVDIADVARPIADMLVALDKVE